MLKKEDGGMKWIYLAQVGESGGIF
jgi:hypothetical protein